MDIVLLDDDREKLGQLAAAFGERGHTVRASETPAVALAAARARRPDVLVCELVMGDSDGIDFCRRVRADPALEDLPLVLLSSRPYAADRARARRAGASGYLLRHMDARELLDALQAIVSNRVRLRYWGVRGTMPRPGRDSVRYGGNTSCVSLEAPDGRLIILDAGSGIRALGQHLSERGGRLTGHLLLSHAHWDHINALPFFSPLYQQGNHFIICGARQDELGVRELVAAQMVQPWFPVTITELAARLEYQELSGGEYDMHGLRVHTMQLSHPGVCLGYRISWADKSVCYITDNELFPPERPEHDPRYEERLADFVRGADVLITDTTYTDEEYEAHIGWGHSAVSAAAELAHRAGVGELHLFHHDPSQDDEAIDRKLDAAQARLEALDSPVLAAAPAEGDLVDL